MSDLEKLIEDVMSRVGVLTDGMLFDNPSGDDVGGVKELNIYKQVEPPRQANVKVQPYTIVRLLTASLIDKKPGSMFDVYLINSIWSWDHGNGISKILELSEKQLQIVRNTNFRPYSLVSPVTFHVGDETGEQLSSNIFESVVRLTFHRAIIFSSKIS